MPGSRMPTSTSDSKNATSNTVAKPHAGWALSQFSSSWVKPASMGSQRQLSCTALGPPHSSANDSRAAATVDSICSSSWAEDTNPASYADGAR